MKEASQKMLDIPSLYSDAYQKSIQPLNQKIDSLKAGKANILELLNSKAA